ncbi:extracellular solute-binding protein [Paenibacillus sp. S150]|uniref:extracellular solute-binding protein n=1 Tax=Paenibacillus sp. S150 TaxID=2749826 RepID=UPI001C5697EF|nr:extracellular solute-binding protein [Paenibacillus sp. S150]MBW4080100.1 extracellular solute-binding protein [Paenibacillus sp. S150]
MLRRRNYWLLFAILLLSLTSLSPSMELDIHDDASPRRQPLNQSERPASGDQDSVQALSIRVSLSSEEFKELERISNNYSLSSGTAVTLSNVDTEDADEILKQDLTIGDSPDIVMTDGRSITDLATQGYLLPVDIYQSIPGSAPLTALIPHMQWNGYDWGVPLDIDPYVLVYSPQRLSELGITGLPRSLEQWNELLRVIREQPDMQRYLLALDTRNPYGYSAVLESMGGSLQPVNPALLEWTQYAGSHFYLTSSMNTELWDMLQAGKLAVAALPLSEWQKHGNSSLAAEAPITAGSGLRYEAMYSRFFALPAQSGNPETAVKWLAYVTSSTAQLDWLQNTGRLPALDELYRTGLPDSVKLPFAAQLLLADEADLESGSAGGWAELSLAVTQLLTGKLDPAGYTAAVAQLSE